MLTFELTPKQYSEFLKWSESKPKSKAADGAQFEFRFLVTGIGIAVKVYDHLSKETLDLTDYNEW